MIDKRINILRTKFKKFEIDGYIIPKNDEFFSEYAVNDRLKTISNVQTYKNPYRENPTLRVTLNLSLNLAQSQVDMLRVR